MLPLDTQHEGSGGLDFSLESHCTAGKQQDKINRWTTLFFKQTLTGQSFGPFWGTGGMKERANALTHSPFLAVVSCGINCISFTFAAGGSCLSWAQSHWFVTVSWKLLLCQGDYTAEHPAETDFRDQKSVGITTLMPASGLDQYMLWLLFSSYIISLSWSQAGPCLRMQDVHSQVWELCT